MPETWNVAESKPERQVSGMAGYVGDVSGHDGQAVMDGKRREEIDTMELYPSMPETWKAAESKCRKEVSGMGGYQRHVSGNDGKQMNVKDHTSHSGKREVRRQGLRQCRIRKVLRGGTMKKRYPA